MDADVLKQLEARFAEQKAELAELEIAVRVIRKYVGDAAAKPAVVQENGHAITAPILANPSVADSVRVVKSHELADMTIRDAAMRVMEDAKGEPLHYREITKRAMERGYNSHKTDELASIERSFWDTLRRRPTPAIVFVGRGRFRLVPEEVAT